MMVSVFIIAVCVAVLGAIAIGGAGELKGNPIQAALMFVLLPLIASYCFVTLGTISGG